MSSTVKSSLRKQVANRLSYLSPNAISTQSINATNLITKQPFYENANSIALYMHLPDIELETNHLLAHALNSNKKVFLPRIEKLEKFNDYKRFEKQKSCLHFLSVSSMDQVNNFIPRGKYQIREPDYEPNMGNDMIHSDTKIDVLFLPAVAYAKDGRRLGHGGGFYDDFIKRYQTHFNHRPLLVGIGLEEQLIMNSQDILLEPHDECLDYVIVGNQFYKCHA